MTIESELRAIKSLLTRIERHLDPEAVDQPRLPKMIEDPIVDDLVEEQSIMVKQTHKGMEQRYSMGAIPERIKAAVRVAREIGAPYQVYQEADNGPFRILTDGEVYTRVARMTINDEPDLSE